MFFADTSSQAVTALQQAFGLERAIAEKLIADVPVMVKRAASPEVADALLDQLNAIGAQVVLMPSTATPSIIPSDSRAGLLEGEQAPWGGLDLKPPATPSLEPTVLASARPSLGGPAETDDLDEWQSGLTAHPPATAIATPVPAPAPVAIAAPTPVPSLTPEAEAYADRFRADAGGSLELAQLEPTPRVFPQRPRSESGESSAAAVDESSTEAAPPQPPPPPPGRPRSKSQDAVAKPKGAGMDLGLGSVPPLPAAPAGRARPPSAPPAAKPAAPPPAPARAARPRPAPAGEGRARSASGSGLQAQLSALAEEPAGSELQVATPGATDPYWAAKRRTQAHTAGSTAGVAQASPARSPIPAPDRSEPRPAIAAATAAEAPSHGAKLAVGGILGGALVLVLGVQFDHSIFTGAADLTWIGLQGMGLFAIGAGVARLRK